MNNLSESEIQNFLKVWEETMRNDIEKKIKVQLKSLEDMLRGRISSESLENALRGQIAVSNTEKSKIIKFMVYSEGTQFPFWHYQFEVNGKTNESDMAKLLDEVFKNYLDSKEFSETQKKLYYKLRMAGIEPIEIYPQIEPRYFDWDYSQQRKFQNKLNQWFGRKLAKKK